QLQKGSNRINISELHPGIYLVRVKNNDNKILLGRLLVR
ncbi:MAG TPA: T9SS type A sorting domain-containing protein, partial [Bacteroidetes bacterium]|nr:T9SS type A sorting domain-containing protein [Bacteroidota bacterium]